MKKLLSTFCFLIIFSTVSVNASTVNTIDNPIKLTQQSNYEAYVYYQGNWYTGMIYTRQSENGFQLSSYSFRNLYIFNGQQFSGNFNQEQRLVRLNPNSELAKNNNFTHYVNIQGVNVYIILN